MELVTIENTRLIRLTQLHRPAGQLFLPNAAGKLIARYSFSKFPPIQELTETREQFTFAMGEFGGAQIQEMRIYSDGFVVESRSNSEILRAFMLDFLAWAASDLGLVPMVTDKPETYHESSLVVRASRDLTTSMRVPMEVVSTLNKMLEISDFKPQKFKPTGFLLDCDAHEPGGRRKPNRFVLERRIGTPFEENVFYSAAPLSTDSHLELLSVLDGLGR